MSRKPTILIVEDSAAQAQELAACLLARGFEVVIATDGPQALRIVDACMPDLVILDIQLPSMTGYQVCERLKRDQRTAKVPVVMLTVANRPEDFQTGYRTGADGYIPKGAFAVEHLLSTLRRIGLETADGTV